MRVRYIRRIASPPALVGEVGEVNDLPIPTADRLVRDGYVVPADGGVLETPAPPNPAGGVRVRYLRRIVTPPGLSGEPGDVAEIPEADASRLAASGHIERIETPEDQGGLYGDTKANTENADNGTTQPRPKGTLSTRGNR